MSTLLAPHTALDIEANGVTREWRIGVGDMAREHMALRFAGTRIGALRRFSAMVRTQPGLAVTLHLVTESGVPAGKAYRSSSPRDCVAERFVDGAWVPLTSPTSSWDAHHACKWLSGSRVRRLTDNAILSEVV